MGKKFRGWHPDVLECSVLAPLTRRERQLVREINQHYQDPADVNILGLSACNRACEDLRELQDQPIAVGVEGVKLVREETGIRDLVNDLGFVRTWPRSRRRLAGTRVDILGE